VVFTSLAVRRCSEYLQQQSHFKQPTNLGTSSMKNNFLLPILGLLTTAFLSLKSLTAWATPTDDLAIYFASPAFLSAGIKENIGIELSDRFLSMMGLEVMPGKAAKPGKYSNEQIKQILNEVDRIVMTAGTPIDEMLIARSNLVRASYTKELGPVTKNWETFLKNPSATEWAKKHTDFQIEAMPLAYLARVLWALSPDKIRFPIWNPPKEYEFISGSLYAGRRYQIQVMLNTDSVASLLPTRFGVARLREIEAETRNTSKPILEKAGYYNGVNGLDGQIYRITLELYGDLAPSLRPRTGQALTELQTLANKFR
jgi:hypothetical protein